MGALTSEERLTLTLLGGFEAHLRAGAALVLPTRKAQALLAYLALPLGQSHPRETLATLLWGDMQDVQARGNLRHALSRIKKALPSIARSALIVDGGSVSLDPAVVDVDVARFERLVADGSADALEQLPGLYRGDLLAGLALDERPFDDWLIAERERLRELAIQALGRLLAHQQKAGAAEQAVQTALRLLALDPLQEPVHRAIMRLYAGIGRRDAALRQYRLCVDLLKRELGTPPEAQTTELYRHIMNARPVHAGRAEMTIPEPVANLPSITATVEVASPTNLPASTSELIGRASAIEEVTELLSVHRLVTLIGTGGVGKTRLGLEVARALLPEFSDGVWFAELASLSDPELVPATVAVAIGLTLPDAAESPERVASALGVKHLLLVLDNCEHLIGAAARMAEAVLRANPRTRVLATSREQLRAPGEYVYRVPSLEVPKDAAGHADPLETAAVKLFVARAQEADVRFCPDARTVAIIGAICRHLDGIPLAIELAAARSAALGVDELAAHLDDRFRLLTGGHRTALPRHQTLRATLDWSSELLPAIERTVLHRVAVFAGGFTLKAASTVAAAADLDPADVVESVANLAAKSLVVVDITVAGTRYRLLETTRAYALEKLSGSGEFDQMARRHAEYFRDLFEQAESERQMLSTIDWLAAYGWQIYNVRSALDWAFSPSGNASIGVALTEAAVPLWLQQSLLVECESRAERALASLERGPGRDARREMQLAAALGVSLMHTKGAAPETVAAWTKVLEIAERLADTEYQLRALWGLWHFHASRGECRRGLLLAERFRDRATNTTEQAVGERMVGASLHYLGDHANARQQVESMLGRYADSVRRAHASRFQYDQKVAAHNTLARILWLQGFPEQAWQTTQNNVDDARAIDHALSLCNALELPCLIALWTDDLVAAEHSVTALLDHTARHALAVRHWGARCFDGALLIARGKPGGGLEVLRAALAELRETSFVPYYPVLLGTLAQGLGETRQVTDGLATVDEALAKCERDEERWWLPELLRIKAELLLLAGGAGAATAAEAELQNALTWTRRQGALSLELRCATDLARLWHAQHRTEPARALVEGIYGRFAEGFTTGDLRAAETLLRRLD